jgi:hypothetical protein
VVAKKKFELDSGDRRPRSCPDIRSRFDNVSGARTDTAGSCTRWQSDPRLLEVGMELNGEGPMELDPLFDDKMRLCLEAR